MSWFEALTGCSEDCPKKLRENLYLAGPRLHSRRNGKSWLYGELEIPTLAQLRQRAGLCKYQPAPVSVREVIANVQSLHADEANQNALFQVASQFNLLEMVDPSVTPEWGVGIYESDPTQGPACAIAAGAGTIYRNYFVELNGQTGQSETNQIDCLRAIGKELGNTNERLWRMWNGYALPTNEGLREIHARLSSQEESEQDRLRDHLHIGVQWETQVTLRDASHTVSQAYCSALPVGYSSLNRDLWEPFATLILEATYEATLCAGILNAARTGNRTVFLTLVGGGAFGNKMDWIMHAIRRSLNLYHDCGLDIAIVSYGRSKPCVQELASEFQ